MSSEEKGTTSLVLPFTGHQKEDAKEAGLRAPGCKQWQQKPKSRSIPVE